MSRLHSESHYKATWRKANEGARTDWDFIGEPAREEWRNSIDAEPPKPVIVWVVCDHVPDFSRFSLGGVFATEEAAAAACTSNYEGIGPHELGKRAPHGPCGWPGFYYPRIPGSREYALQIREQEEAKLAAVYAAEASTNDEGDFDHE